MSGPRRASAWRALARAPMPVYAADPLRRLAARSGHGVLRAIRAAAFEANACSIRLETLKPVFGFGLRDHAFDAPAHDWTRFREPQITAGLAHFLQSGPCRQRRARISDFLAAVFESVNAPALLRHPNTTDIVSAEAVAEDARVDLVVQATTREGGHLGVIIEAKFDHHLTAKQLPAARRHALKRGLHGGNAIFLVVLPHRADVGTRIFSRAPNRDWKALSWWTLLRNLEVRLRRDVDDHAFRSFRHTIWRQTYG